MADHHTTGTVITQSLGGDHGLDVIDPIERLRRTIRTGGPVEPASVDGDPFPMPIESAVEIETATLSLPVESQLCVRDADGRMLEEVQLGTCRSLPEATYCLEPGGIVKLYVVVESSLEIRQEEGSTEIGFGGEVPVAVGSCSTHERPAATVTVRDEPADLLAAVSSFGSALKTLSPERAFPTNRGHPPTIELGDACDVPDELRPPAEDVEVQVPATYNAAFVVAPLAYYLGAPVSEGPPRIVADSFEHSLEHRGDLEAGVERTLKQVFLLDCVTRTEGIYRVDLHEREWVERRLDLDFQSLYESPHERRLATYLEVPFERIEDCVPDWKQTAHVDPEASNAEALPYVVDDLALVRAARPEPVPDEAVQIGSARGVLRGETSGEPTYVHPADPADTIEETWLGDGTPIGASKALPGAFENRLGRSTSADSIDISVVCNAEEMADEGSVADETYGSRSELAFDVTVRTETSTDELGELLAEDRDFFHYIGHIDDDGFRCSDGRLDASEIDDVGMDAFFLNACQSYEQGRALVESGAIGGIVTVRDVANLGAVQIGQAVARLLNCGFPLRPALEVAREESVMGTNYIVVGDGGLSIVQPESGTPHLLEVRRCGDSFEVGIDLFGAEPGMGGLFSPHFEAGSQYYLASGSVPPVTVSADDFEAVLHRENGPVRRNGWLLWSDDLSCTDF